MLLLYFRFRGVEVRTRFAFTLTMKPDDSFEEVPIGQFARLGVCRKVFEYYAR